MSAGGRRRPRWLDHSLRPTRQGWWCLLATLGLGLAAVNTGSNLLYLLLAMMLALIVVSGLLSEQSIRGLRVAPLVPDEVYAGAPVLAGARVANAKRWLTSYSIAFEMVGPDGGRRRGGYLVRLPPGAAQVVTWELTFPTRGLQPFPRPRVVTRFPFGLFVKAGPVSGDATVTVFPRLAPVSGVPSGDAASGGGVSRRRGRGHDLHDLRGYRDGDDPRLIHWRSSAKTGSLTVRELEADATSDTRLVLEPAPRPEPVAVERALSEAASLAAHLLARGAAVELTGPGLLVPFARGRAQRRRVLTALALYDAAAAPGAAGVDLAGQSAPRVRNILITVG